MEVKSSEIMIIVRIRIYATFNPFTTVLAALSLLKRPIKVANLKSLMPFSPSHEHMKGLLSKCTVWKIYLF